MKYIRKILPLSDEGFRSLRLGILASTFRDLCAFLPFVILWRLMAVVLQPITAHTAPNLAEIQELGLWGVAVCALMLLTCWLSDRANNIPTYREMDRMRRAAAEKLMDMPMSFLNAQSGGDLVNHMMADCANCEVVMSGLVPGLISHGITALVIFGALSLVNWKLSLAAFCVIPVSLAIQTLSLRLQARLTRRQLKAKRRAEGTMLEYLESMPVIKAYNLSGEQFDRLAADLNAVRRISTKLELTAGIFVSGAEVFLQLGIGIVILFGTAMFSADQIPLITLLLFFAVILRIYEPIAEALGELSNLIYMRESLDRLRALFAAPSDVRPDGTLSQFDIEVSHVTFRYTPGGNDILRDLTFSVPEGSITAIVGPSGEGKTTTLRLLSRLWEPQQGRICIGGVDISSLSIRSYHQYLSVVDQDTVLFHDTVLNNICIGNPDAPREAVIAAAEAAQCGEFVRRLEHGYDTVLAENGQSLSGGERQRISIARAILKDAPLLLLDEATASLDPENEALVQTAISGLLRRGKTILVVAHRLNTIEDADQILVIEGGTVTQRGTHTELMSQDGCYRRLYQTQAQAKEWTISSETDRSIGANAWNDQLFQEYLL